MPHSPDRAALEKQRRRLKAYVLGMLDMDLVRNTARYLHDTFEVGTLGAHDSEHGYTWRVRRTLEAGLFTVYARGFVDTRSPGVYRVPRLSPPTLPDNLRELHEWMLEQRSLVYAHTAAVEYRPIPQLDDEGWLDHLRESEDFNEGWYPPSPDRLVELDELAVANRTHFHLKFDRLRRKLES